MISSKVQSAEYIVTIAKDLAQMAQTHGHQHLAYLLAMVQIEAETAASGINGDSGNLDRNLEELRVLAKS